MNHERFKICVKIQILSGNKFPDLTLTLIFNNGLCLVYHIRVRVKLYDVNASLHKSAFKRTV